MKKFLLGLVLVASLVFSPLNAAVEPCKFAYPTVTGGTFDKDCSFVSDLGQAAFNKVYWDAQPKEVKDLANLPTYEARRAKAFELIAPPLKLKNVDYVIHVQGLDPWQTMLFRIQYGYTWVPSAGQEGLVLAPGISFPGMDPYNPAAPPDGSIKVSLDAKDYPSLVVPVPVPVKPTNVISAVGFGNIYPSGPGDSLAKYPDGSVFKASYGTFLKHAKITPFGPSVYWEKMPKGWVAPVKRAKTVKK